MNPYLKTGLQYFAMCIFVAAGCAGALWYDRHETAMAAEQWTESTYDYTINAIDHMGFKERRAQEFIDDRNYTAAADRLRDARSVAEDALAWIHNRTAPSGAGLYKDATELYFESAVTYYHANEYCVAGRGFTMDCSNVSAYRQTMDNRLEIMWDRYAEIVGRAA